MATAEQIEKLLGRPLKYQDLLIKIDPSDVQESEPLFYEVGGFRPNDISGDKTIFSFSANRYYPHIGILSEIQAMIFHSDEDIWKGVIKGEDRIDRRR
jgi:hypothetical protein